MVVNKDVFARWATHAAFALGAWCASFPFASAALAAQGTVIVTVKSPSATGTNIGVGFRWLLEEDSTYAVTPGDATTTDSLALNMHKSHMSVVAKGHSDANPAQVPVPDTGKRYFLSILPDQSAPGSTTPLDCQHAGCYTMSGRQVTPDLFGGTTSASLTVAVTGQPVPTAQIFARAYEDSAPINGVWDDGEAPLGGWAVFIYDMGGQLATDTFGNPLGTVYRGVEADGTPHIERLGDTTMHTMTAEEVADPARNPYGLEIGEVLVKNIAPGKYGIQIVPPEGQGWVQTATIEGTLGFDAWVKANEPRYFAEFGPAGHHAEFGYVNPSAQYNSFPGNVLTGGHTISGRVVNLRMSRPPQYSFSAGHPLAGCWIGLNDATNTQGLFTAPCNADSEFTIPNVPDGVYQLVLFDRYLDNIIAFQSVTVSGGDLNLEDIPVFRWYGSHDHYVYNDLNENGIWDAGENGIPDMAINLRYRDGSIYNSSTTDTTGYLPFDEIFPFFSWLIAEVDFARYKAVSVTIATDGGGPVDPNNPIGRGKLTPQLQDPDNGGTNCGAGGDNCQTRTEIAHWEPNPDNIVAPPLLEGYNDFLSTTNVFEWGKKAYGPGENGGITGVIYYPTTRAENDPRFAAAETWEPGIPRVALALYRSDANGVTYHKNADGSRGALTSALSPLALADVDNYPLDNFPGLEDIDHNNNSVFDLGDALEVAHSDSWDDSIPTGCPGNPSDPFHQPTDPDTGLPAATATPYNGKCYDGLRNYSQIRPAVFDGGYAFGKPFTSLPLANGYYVVQVNAPRGLMADGSYGDVYEVQQEEDKNVDFGDAMAVSTQALPPPCVGGPGTTGTPAHEAGTELALFHGVDLDPRYQGARPGCDFRLVFMSDGKNTAADFFMFTETPITGHIQGFVLNDLANEFDPLSPNFGEKMAPSWIPVSVRDYAGNEVYHTYTDRWGTYNAIVPTAYRINTPMPSGVSPNLLQVCLNAPTTQDKSGAWIPEPYHNPQYTQFCYTLDFKPGQTTYLDTPVLPIAAFVGPSNWQLDCDYPSGTPVIKMVTVNGANGPYVPSSGPRQLIVYSMGSVQVPDPFAPRIDATLAGGNNQTKVTRDFGFGNTAGRVWIGTTEVTANTTWGNASLSINLPAGVRTGQLRIRRSSGFETVQGLTVTVDQAGQPASVVRRVHMGEKIQDVIDLANAGDLVLVEPGVYLDMLVMTKPIRLQGSGAPVTIINPVPSPTEKIALWHEKLNALANCTQEIGLLPGQGNNTASASGPCGFTPNTGLFPNEAGAGVLVAPRSGAFSRAAARVDGFTITGADQAGGVVVNGYATGLEISNNILANNQGPFAAGIRAGQPMLLTATAAGDEEPIDADNDGLRIHHNHVKENGGLFEAGAGIGLYTGTDNYLVNRNYVCGNFAGGNGAGIAHYGNSTGGRILDNKILFNQAFDQTVANSGNGGGIFVGGYAPAAGGATPGAGSVSIERNLIQGNNAGSGNGGGIALQFVAPGAGNVNVVDILNNLIVNNVAGYKAGGIAMDNAAHVLIRNNTIVNNDSTGTAANAFANTLWCSTAVNSTVSCPQGAGIYSAGGNIGPGGLRNNIILGNRALHVGINPANGGITSFVDGFADLEGAGLYTGTGANPNNGVRNSLLSSTNIVLGGGTPAYCSSPAGSAPRGNTCRNPVTIETAQFVYPYWNSAPTFGSSGTYTPPEAGTLANLQSPPSIAAAVDEGGNFIDVHYGPLSRVYQATNGVETLNDYHLLSTAADAINATQTCAGACSGNSEAPGIDVDSQTRPKTTGGANANPADRGADEYWAGYAPGATPINNQANLAPEIPNIADQAALTGLRFGFQVPATDPNGDPLQFRLTTAPTGMTIEPGTGVISWQPTWPPVGCNGNGNATRNCNVTVQASDNAFAGNTCPASNCASRDFTVSLRHYVGNGPTAVNDNNVAINVNAGSLFTLPAPGVLANDTNQNAQVVSLTAILAQDNTTNSGKFTLGADGSVAFIPNADFVGTTTFRYRVTDGVNTSALPGALVTLQREITAPVARYINGTWTFDGLGNVNGRRIQIVRNRGNMQLTPAQNNLRPQVQAGHWSFSRTGGPGFQPGDTVTITARTNNNAGTPITFSLIGVQVFAGALTDVQNSVYVQCPGDTNGDAVIDAPNPQHPNAVCRHLAAGDGFSVMADGTELYTFGFNDVTGTPPSLAIDKGILNAQFPAPTLNFKEGDEVYLTLTNVGMLKRPDLFDPHSVHFHGFPNAGSVFDGVPESSVAINMGFSFTYYYKIVDPGTFMYHCHVEASEHMQMGMLGNLYVDPIQNGTSKLFGGKTYTSFVYNDGDGSTGYDVQVPIQIGSFDSAFHQEHLAVQPLPFANMFDDYPMLNGRGYPDTVNPDPIPVAAGDEAEKVNSGVTSASESSQVVHSIVRAQAGQRVLLRISNLNVTQFYTLGTTGGLQMQIVGTGAHILRGPAGASLYYKTSSVTLGGGEAVDVLIDTTGVAPGRYLLYSTNLNKLSNGPEDFGGMMTEIIIE